MNIIPDWTQVLLNTVPFLVAIVGMYFIILKPMLNTFWSARSGRGGHDEARIETEIKDRMAEYERKLAAARAEVAYRAEKRLELKASTRRALALLERQPRLKSNRPGEISSCEAASAQLKTMSSDIADR